MTRSRAADAAVLHERAYVFDGHNDVAGALRRGESFDNREGRGHLDRRRMREGGLDGGIFAVFVDPAEPDPLGRTLEGLAHLRDTLEAHPEVDVVRSAADLAGARARTAEDPTHPLVAPAHEDRMAAVLGVEGGYAIDADLGVLDELFDAGMRCLTLTWNEPTAWADPAGGGPHGGLTEFGRRLVDRAQRLGVLLDLSHAADSTARQVLDRAERPVVASHSGMRRLANLPRNLSDPLLEGIAETGGLVGISFFCAHLSAEFEASYAPLREREFASHEELAATVRAEIGALPIERLVEHVAHAVHVAGAGHVGLGSDFDGMWALPEGLDDVADLPRLTAELVAARVFDADGVEAFLGLNWLRVLDEALP